MSLIFVLGNVGGALAASILPESIIGAGAATAGAGGIGSASLTAGTSLAGLTGASTGVPATAEQIAQHAAEIGVTNADKAALASQATSGFATNASVVPGSTSVVPGATTSTASALPTTGSAALDTAIVSGGVGGVQQGVQAKQQADATTAQNKGYRQLSAKQGGEEAQALKDVRNTLGGGMMLAEGGGVNLQSGQFVIPADIVSDLGNGDTKAGMEFLKQFFETGGHA